MSAPGFSVEVFQNEYLPDGSMSSPMAKMIAARQATAVAIDAIRDGVAFAVIAGTPSRPRASSALRTQANHGTISYRHFD